MSFITITFVIFLAIVFCLYWNLPRPGLQNAFLLGASYVFYGWWDWRFCGLMLGSSLLDFYAGLALSRLAPSPARRAVLGLTLSANLGVLGFFKYFDFFAESLQSAAGLLGWSVSPLVLQVALPVGISFYTFQSMSYAIDVYRGAIPATRQLVEYLAYVSFFPQLVAGPIERARHFLPQFCRARTFDYEQAVDGCRQMLWGFGKKMLVADNLAPIVERFYGNTAGATGPELLVATLAFALQIYCDFSAYSDIAVGSARLLGFQLMRNFDHPYFAASLAEFWRRWHISLTTWFRDYVYIPLGGNRGSRARWRINVLAVFLLSGLWHGAAWTFLAWGAFHGVALLIENAATRPGRDSPGLAKPGSARSRLGRVKTASRIVLTFSLVNIGWIFFRASSVGEALAIVARIAPCLGQLETLFHLPAAAASGPLGGAITPVVAGFLAVEWLTRDQAHPLDFRRWPWVPRWVVYVAGAVALLLWGTYGSSEFIYFQF